MIDRALLARIRKCFALSASANEHEAAAALAKARALMAEHGVSDEDLRLADVEEATARGSRTRTPPQWESLLCICVERALNVHAVIDGIGDWLFIGHGPSAEIASYAFTTLRRRLKAARADYIQQQLRRCRPARKRLRADVFCEGWAESVYAKVARLSPDRRDDEAVQHYIAKRFGSALKQVSSRQSDGVRTDRDWFNGRASGRTVDLHHGMSGGDGQRALAHD